MHPNRLINEKSPYLLQHAHNPVDWYPWSAEAFERAAAENKPVFLSIGYATCHWCHVMEKESFEDEEVARHLNDTFVCIKVDREERPDIDSVYMSACQMLTGSGGWPLTILLTSDKKPFFAGTYLPKYGRYGRPGMIEVCQQVQNLWRHEKGKILASAESIAGSLSRAFVFDSAKAPGAEILEVTYRQLDKSFDERFGGFESAPKFPTPHRLFFLLRYYKRTRNHKALDMVCRTLMAMRRGGVWDHVGFGFHRYSTDRKWLLPHFEKMLYDQALLAMAYLETFQVTKDPFYAATAEQIFTYVLRDMTSSQGGFYAAEDADSEGEEGKFYVWTTMEFGQVLGGNMAARWQKIFDLKDQGNFSDEATGQKSGVNILHLERSFSEWAGELGIDGQKLNREWEKVRQKLFQVREKRIHPLKDDKILTDWNGLMIAALAMGSRLLGKPRYAAAARKAAAFILSRMKDRLGRLRHRYREGESAIDAHADDYTFVIFGLLNLYAATFEPDYIISAVRLQEQMLNDFWDEDNGGFFLTATGSTELPVRPKELYDGAIPSANSVALFNLLCLSRLTGDPIWEQKAHEQIHAFSGTVTERPWVHTHFLLGVDFVNNPGKTVVIAGEPHEKETKAMLSVIDQNFNPATVTLLKTERHAPKISKIAPFTVGMKPINGKTTAFVCSGFSCSRPTTDLDRMKALIEKG